MQQSSETEDVMGDPLPFCLGYLKRMYWESLCSFLIQQFYSFLIYDSIFSHPRYGNVISFVHFQFLKSEILF